MQLLFRRKRKAYSPFILIEVIVATSLFAILLAVMFGIFVRYSQTNQFLAKQRARCEKLLVVQSKLQALFDQSVFQKNETHYFYIEEPKISSSPSLIFTFENIIDRNVPFSSKILGRLYVDQEKLCFAAWPDMEDLDKLPTVMQKEILLSGVESLQIELLARPQSKTKKAAKDAQKIIEGKWLTTWPMEYKRRPSLIKLICKRTTGETIPFWFFIPNETQPILYLK